MNADSFNYSSMYSHYVTKKAKGTTYQYDKHPIFYAPAEKKESLYLSYENDCKFLLHLKISYELKMCHQFDPWSFSKKCTNPRPYLVMKTKS